MTAAFLLWSAIGILLVMALVTICLGPRAGTEREELPSKCQGCGGEIDEVLAQCAFRCVVPGCRKRVWFCRECIQRLGPYNLRCPEHGARQAGGPPWVQVAPGPDGPWGTVGFRYSTDRRKALFSYRFPERRKTGVRIELSTVTEQVPARTRAEIPPEVFDELSSSIEAAIVQMRALRESIPCYLSSIKVVSDRLEKDLALARGALGKIDIVRPGHVCPLCKESYAADVRFVCGLCPECARDRGMTEEPTA